MLYLIKKYNNNSFFYLGVEKSQYLCGFPDFFHGQNRENLRTNWGELLDILGIKIWTK